MYIMYYICIYYRKFTPESLNVQMCKCAKRAALINNVRTRAKFSQIYSFFS